MSADAIEFNRVGNFTSAFVPVVKVTEVKRGASDFLALAYQCKMNVDWSRAIGTFSEWRGCDSR